MKIAYCLAGLVGGLSGHNYDKTEGGDVVIRESSNNLFKNINCNDIDFFMHTWSIDKKEKLESVYKPKKAIYEEQIIFKTPTYLPTIPRVQATYSRWYSSKQVIKLKRQYEEENNFKYDLVVITRQDLYWLKPFDFNSLDNTKFNAAQSRFKGKVYGSPDGIEIEDILFASNSDYMDQFCTLYDFLDEYTKPDQCPTWNFISSHFLSVWHLKKLNLWDRISFPFIHYAPNNTKLEDSNFGAVKNINI